MSICTGRLGLFTLLEAPLDVENQPKSRELSEGRFVVTTDRFLDPYVYVKDRQLTVGGRISGVREETVSGTIYRYPVIEAQELHLWRKGVSRVPVALLPVL